MRETNIMGLNNKQPLEKMRFRPIEKQDKMGRTVVIRNAEVTDAKALLVYA